MSDSSLSGHPLTRKVASLLAQESRTAALLTGMGESRFRRWVADKWFVAALTEVRQAAG